jgi:hypothetical protein
MSDAPPEVPDLGIVRAKVPDDARCETHPSEHATFRCTLCTTYRCEACLWGRRGAREICARCAEGGLPAPVSWERRDEIGLVGGFFGTLREVCFSPTRFYRTPALENDAIGGFEHGLVSFALGQIAVVVQAVLALLIFGGTVAIASRMPLVAAFMGGYSCVLFAILPSMIVHVPVTGIVSVGMASTAIHGTLRALGVETAPFFAGTVRAVSYAFATQICMVIPVVGPLVTLVWMLVLEVIAMREVHKTHVAFACIAVLGYRAFFLFAGLALYAFFGVAALAAGTR